MVNSINDICIVGGGTAGWMCAAYLKKHTNINVTLIESDQVPTIGVGESVPPHVMEFIKRLDIDIFEFLRETGAVIKYSNCFRNWNKLNDEYHFGFTQTLGEASFANGATQPAQKRTDFTHDFTKTRITDYFSEFVKQGVYKPEDFVERFCESYYYLNSNKTTFYKNTEGWQNRLPEFSTYAFHVDSERTGKWLSSKIKVDNHIVDHITDVIVEQGNIKKLRTKNNKIITADLFVDCTGLSRLLIDKLGNWKSFDLVPCTHSWVAPYSYKDPETECVNYTQSTARDNGWTFEISLYGRMGSGYVWSDKYCDDQESLKEFYQCVPSDRFLAEPRLLSWNPGTYEKPFINNVCAIGLAAGFIEPLEANNLYFVVSFITELAHVINGKDSVDYFNEVYDYAIHDTYEFIHTHYNLTNRTDTEFWRWQNRVGQEHNTKEIVFRRYNQEHNNYGDAINGFTEFPEYMWYKLAIYFGLDITDMSRPVRKELMDIAFLHFESVKARGKHGANISSNYRKWLDIVNNKEKGQ